MSGEAEVYMQIGDQDVSVGQLYAHERRGAQSATFRYDDSWLAGNRAFPVDPALDLYSGPIQSAEGQKLFGAFSDSAPDRWGRRLINRQERKRAERADETPHTFTEFDYLMRVRDDGRQGALRFRHPGSSEWAAGPDGFPHLADLPRLLRSSQNVQRDTETAEDLTLLVRAGSSLGGARPKAHVLLAGGRLAIAKFPSTTDDDHSVVQWEHVALDLAKNAGIDASPGELHEVTEIDTPVLIVERFDRQGESRIGYISAMTALEAAEHDHRSYVEIAQFLEPVSPTAERDLHELWRRVVFGILISNTDDHLRNHGFLRRSNGWQLAPAFDVNPDSSPGVKRFATTIDAGSGDRSSIEEALQQAPYFRLGESDAVAILRQVVEGVSPWREVARASGIPVAEIDSMSHAFDHEESEAARRLA